MDLSIFAILAITLDKKHLHPFKGAGATILHTYKFENAKLSHQNYAAIGFFLPRFLPARPRNFEFAFFGFEFCERSGDPRPWFGLER